MPQFLEDILEEEKRTLKMEIKSQVLCSKNKNQNKNIESTSNKSIDVSEF